MIVTHAQTRCCSEPRMMRSVSTTVWSHLGVCRWLFVSVLHKKLGSLNNRDPCDTTTCLL